MAKKTRVAINGFGRIGSSVFRVAFSEHLDDLDIVAINDPGTVEDAAFKLKYDSVYHSFPGEITVDGDNMVVDGVKIKKITELDPSKLPWKDLDIDVVLECTGVFRTKEQASMHLQAGAKTVIISAPAKGDDPVGTYVMGVNHKDLDANKEKVISNASCTTNCIAPIMKILEETFGIEKAMMTTVHAYTADQNLVDGSHKDPRRARSAGINIIPTTTGAAKATGLTIPSIQGKFDGISIRVPVPVGSLSDITAVLKKDATIEEINEALTKASESEDLKGILGVTNDPLVSTDIIGNPLSCVVDLQMTNVVAGNLLKVVAWYDNEYGYSKRMVEQVIEIGKDLK
ncbi:MAG: type I glyceraldehyde-3-phosphate dehydrogenase [Candidatus Kerfeldbacteria bacterium]